MFVDFNRFADKNPVQFYVSGLRIEVEVEDLDAITRGHTDKVFFFSAGALLVAQHPIVNGIVDIKQLKFVSLMAILCSKNNVTQPPLICSHSSYTNSGFGTAYCKYCPATGKYVNGVLKW